ncbi:baseplate J/gp47 family protein [uncultured Chitinophaga sp.]|jgi:Baseplate J-like protein.|uniref:baseplate J/gp47 family protein n=1 Tax=uncultured Chitinophaga sp. TaxID=339340 RepID=UPI00262936C7|nr:baseplate J/gp47 family protein [uncultured Chitinophaga sp.]
MEYFCCNDARRNQVMEHPTINGIDFLEVLDNPADPLPLRQTTLYVHFLKDIVPGSLSEKNVVIAGGERIKDIKVTSVTTGLILSPPPSPPDPDAAKILVVQVEAAGDFSTYTLHLVADAANSDAPTGYDPVLSSVDFSFKVLCGNDFDCKPQFSCAPVPPPAPELNYLAKDYATFRQLMLDRLNLLIPQWRERNIADEGIALVELLAYAGDYLSYQQDAIATEAYLGTARRRVSVRRHARLIDYFVHDGCNARTWAHIEIAAGITGLLLQQQNTYGITKILTRTSAIPAAFRSDSKEFEGAMSEGALVFELMHDIILDHRHNQMAFYTWKDSQCCLPQGATSATLKGNFAALTPGMVLILAEVLGPQTGEPGDADPNHRHPVRLSDVRVTEDPLDNQPVTIIQWEAADALPFPLCISTRNERGEFPNVSLALGNNVLVDHGMTAEFPLDPVPSPRLSVRVPDGDPCEVTETTNIPLRYYPKLKFGPVTQVAPYQPDSALSARQWSMRNVLPAIQLLEAGSPHTWTPQRDLLNSKPADLHFVVEVENDGTAYLRFGDDLLGKRPAPETAFTVRCRIGNGDSGNIGIQPKVYLVSDDPDITGANEKIRAVSMPLPAIGAMEQESIQMVRQKAPNAFRKQERAVTLEDYEQLTRSVDQTVQRSAATFRWTGSWRTVFLTVDRLGGEAIAADFETQIRQKLERYRMAGHDLEVNSPVYISLEIEMVVCVNEHYFRSDVQAALLQIFSNRDLPRGGRGLFHPDNFSFGQTVYLSPLYAAAQQTPGVDAVEITKFNRQGRTDTVALEKGELSLSRLEIARLDNDPNFPEHGVFRLIMNGGK